MSVETGFPNPDLGRINKQVFKTQILPEAMKDEVAEVHEFTKQGIKEFVNSEWRQKNEQFLGGKEGIGKLQTALQEKGYYKGVVDNAFGPGTLVALLNFQLKNGLDTDGIAGSLTQEKLGLKEAAKGVLDTLGANNTFNSAESRILSIFRSRLGLQKSTSGDVFDDALKQEIKKFQDKWNQGVFGKIPMSPLRNDGFPDEETFRALGQYLNPKGRIEETEGIAPHTLANLRSYFGIPRSKEPLDAELKAKIQDFQLKYNDGEMTLFGRKPDVSLRTDGFPDEKTTKIILTLSSMRYIRF